MDKGYTAIEALVATLIGSWIMFFLVLLLNQLINIPINAITQLDVALLQLNWHLSFIEELKMIDDQVCYDQKETTHCFLIKDKRLVITPGWRIVLDDVEDVELTLMDQKLILRFTHKGKSFEKILKE